MMHDCEHFGKTSEEIDMIEGMTWMLENCETCFEWKACVEASRESTERRVPK